MPRQKKSRAIPAGEFKTHCLAIMDRVYETGEEVTVTKHGKPVAKLVPVVDEPDPLFGRLAGWVTHEGDLVAPIDVDWEADAE